MPVKNDTRHKAIGSQHRALSRWYMLLHRTNNSHLPRNRKYADVKVLVTKEEFIEWFMPRDFKGASVDRVDNSGHYELSNMAVIPIGTNIRKDRTKAVDGLCECYSCKETKPLEEMTKDSRRKTGRSTLCKKCDNKRPKKARQPHDLLRD